MPSSALVSIDENHTILRWLPSVFEALVASPERPGIVRPRSYVLPPTVRTQLRNLIFPVSAPCLSLYHFSLYDQRLIIIVIVGIIAQGSWSIRSCNQNRFEYLSDRRDGPPHGAPLSAFVWSPKRVRCGYAWFGLCWTVDRGVRGRYRRVFRIGDVNRPPVVACTWTTGELSSISMELSMRGIR